MLDELLTQDGEGPQYTPQSPGLDLDAVFGNKGRVLRTKLEVFASEIFERFRIRLQNLALIEEDQNKLYDLLDKLDRQARYHLREHAEKRVLYEFLFKVKQERRAQDVECWRDVVMVMRDFLYTWDAHQQMKARARLLDHVGS
jgi:hypothetical protein